MTKLRKVFLSHTNLDETSYICKISYLIKIFDIILPKLDPRPEEKNMTKYKQSKSQIELKLPNNTN